MFWKFDVYTMSSKNKFNRHTFAFLTIAFVSIFLYPVAVSGTITLVWILLGLVVLAATLILITK